MASSAILTDSVSMTKLVDDDDTYVNVDIDDDDDDDGDIDDADDAHVQFANSLSAIRLCRSCTPPTPSAGVFIQYNGAKCTNGVPPGSHALNTWPSGPAAASVQVCTAVAPISLNDVQTGRENGKYHKMPIPLCSICNSESTGIHFGVEACAACSAFFRRTVVLEKNYQCSKGGKCKVNKDTITGQKCRSCRFKKCISVGMERSGIVSLAYFPIASCFRHFFDHSEKAVQRRRDAIGKHSTLAKRNSGSSCGDPSPDPSMTPEDCSNHSRNPTCSLSLIGEMKENYAILNKRRKLMYEKRSLTEIFDENADLEPTMVSDFGACMSQIWQIEPRLCAEFVATNSRLFQLNPSEKAIICKNFIITFQSAEQSYLTWRHNGLARNIWMMPNRSYINLIPNIDKEFGYLLTQSIVIDNKVITNIFLPSIKDAMVTIVDQMAKLNISEHELIILTSILLLDSSGHELDQNCRFLMQKLRDELFREALSHYKHEMRACNPEVRLGEILLLISEIKVFAHRWLENLQLMSAFGILPRNELLNEIFGIV